MIYMHYVSTVRGGIMYNYTPLGCTAGVIYSPWFQLFFLRSSEFTEFSPEPLNAARDSGSTSGTLLSFTCVLVQLSAGEEELLSSVRLETRRSAENMVKTSTCYTHTLSPGSTLCWLIHQRAQLAHLARVANCSQSLNANARSLAQACSSDRWWSLAPTHSLF